MYMHYGWQPVVQSGAPLQSGSVYILVPHMPTFIQARLIRVDGIRAGEREWDGLSSSKLGAEESLQASAGTEVGAAACRLASDLVARAETAAGCEECSNALWRAVHSEEVDISRARAHLSQHRERLCEIVEALRHSAGSHAEGFEPVCDDSRPARARSLPSEDSCSPSVAPLVGSCMAILGALCLRSRIDAGRPHV